MVGPTFKFWLWRDEDWVFGPIVAVSGIFVIIGLLFLGAVLWQSL